MHKVLDTPELLDAIISCCSRRTKTIAARVCRTWLAHSIPFIWNMARLDDILKVLYPDPDDGGARGSFPYAWDRFFLYSKNVRRLDCDGGDYGALAQVALWRPSSDLFSPKLTHIRWYSEIKEDFEYLLPLLTLSLKTLDLSLYHPTSPDMIYILRKMVPERSPSLHEFRLQVDDPSVDNVNTQFDTQSKFLGELMSLLSKLVVSIIPMHLMSSELFIILSQLPRLEDLILSDSYFPDSDQCRLIDMCDEEAAQQLPFHSLQRMVISDCISGNRTFTMANAFGHGIQLPMLVDLTCSPRCEDPSQLIALMEMVPVICPNLRNMSIWEAHPTGDIPSQAILALLKCPALVELGVGCDCVVDMELQDIITIANDRTSWEFVHLPTFSLLDFQGLVAFAQNCPNLYELGLRLNTDLPLPDIREDVKFCSLVSLHVRDSPITHKSQAEVAMFLSGICRKRLHIESWRTPSWDAVEKMADILIMSQREVRKLKKKIAFLQSGRSIDS